MRPFVLSALLLLYAMAHAAAGMVVAARADSWLVTPLWIVSMCGLMAAAFAVAGLERLQPVAERATYAATFASVALMRLAGVGVLFFIALGVALVCAALVRWWARCSHPEIHTATLGTSPELAPVADPPSFVRRVGAAAAYVLLVYTALLIALRPSSGAPRLADSGETPAPLPSLAALVRAPLDLYRVQPVRRHPLP